MLCTLFNCLFLWYVCVDRFVILLQFRLRIRICDFQARPRFRILRFSSVAISVYVGRLSETLNRSVRRFWFVRGFYTSLIRSFFVISTDIIPSHSIFFYFVIFMFFMTSNSIFNSKSNSKSNSNSNSKVRDSL